MLSRRNASSSTTSSPFATPHHPPASQANQTMGDSSAIRTGSKAIVTAMHETNVSLAMSTSSSGGDTSKLRANEPIISGDANDVDKLDSASGTGTGNGNWWLDRYSLLLLVSLYTAQGLPMGLAFGAIPFLLKEKGASYGDIAWFSFVGIPYSIKLLIAPIVDSFYHHQFGRRKSWIIPIQSTLALVMLIFSSTIHQWVLTRNVSKLTPMFLTIIALTATQDIAVDGWSLTMLRRRNVAYASTCQSLGLSLGFFATFTIFLSLSNAEFCDAYVRYYLAPLFTTFQSPGNKGALVDLAGALQCVGAFYLVLTVYIAIFKKESNSVELKPDGKKSEVGVKDEHLPLSVASDDDTANDDDVDTNENDKNSINSNTNSNMSSNNDISHRAAKLYRRIASTYADMFFALRLPAVRSLVFCLLIAKVGFSAYDNVTPLKLLELGFSKEKMASMAVLQTPFILIGTILTGRLVGQYSPVRVYLFGWVLRLIFSLSGAFLVVTLKDLNGVVTPWFYFVVLGVAIVYSLASECLMFVGAGALFLTVSASSVHVAGSYLTLLNTSSNMGGIWHKALVLWLVDRLTIREDCSVTGSTSTCPITYDGYYIMCVTLIPVAIMVGFHLFRTLPTLERRPDSAWRASR